MNREFIILVMDQEDTVNTGYTDRTRTVTQTGEEEKGRQRVKEPWMVRGRCNGVSHL